MSEALRDSREAGAVRRLRNVIQRRRSPGRVRERGIIIVVALLVLVSLAGVALVGTQQTRSEIDMSGIYRMRRVGSADTVFGAVRVVSFLRNYGNLVLEEVLRAGRTEPVVLTQEQLFPEAPDPTDPNPRKVPRFEASVQLVGLVDGVAAGYAAGEFSFARLVVTVEGNFSVGTTEEHGDIAQTQMRVFMLVGPITDAGSRHAPTGS